MLYHKIDSIYKRDMESKHKNFIMGEWANPAFEFLQNNTWQFTEKVDGTNIRVIYRDGVVTFGGRTEDAQIPAKLVTRLQELFPAEKMEKVFLTADAETSVVLYGEGYGPGIQKGGGNYKSSIDFVLFDVRIGHWWLERKNVEIIAEELSIGTVPIVGEGTIHDAIKLVQDGFKSQWGDFTAEGLVLRPKIYLQDRKGNRIITKIKYKDFR